MNTPNWEPACNTPAWLKPRRTLYFLWSKETGPREATNGRLITYPSMEKAQKAADKLNTKPTP